MTAGDRLAQMEHVWDTAVKSVKKLSRIGIRLDQRVWPHVPPGIE